MEWVAARLATLGDSYGRAAVPMSCSVRGPVLQKFRRKIRDLSVRRIIGHKVAEDRVHVCLADRSTIDVIDVKEVGPLIFGFVREGNGSNVVAVDAVLEH